MADIFNSRPGIVQVFNADVETVGRVKIGGFASQAVLISGIDYTQRTNQQFQYSLNRAVYVYMFGDLMGSVVVNGLAFPSMCEGDGGISEILAFYNTKRAVVSGETITIALGKETITGFMTELQLRAITSGYDAAPPAEEFRIVVNTVPRTSGKAASATPSPLIRV
jgi:hypothetical protein